MDQEGGRRANGPATAQEVIAPMQSHDTAAKKKPLPPGIQARHSRECPSRQGGACKCKPTFRAWIYDRRAATKVYSPAFSMQAAAKQWRADALSALGHGRFVGPTRQTLRQAAEAWLGGAEADPPTILNRSGKRYKSSVLRGYRADMEHHVLDDLGGAKLSEIRRGDLQALVDRLLGQGLSSSKVRNVLVALRVVFRHAVEREELGANPTTGLRLPNGVGHRERIADPSEAATLIAALPIDLQALYATAAYAGLRRGELRALRFDDVDLADGIIHVRHGWDDADGEILPKSSAGLRRVPIAPLLRDHLTAHKFRTGRDGRDFVFGPKPDRVFTPTHIRKQALKAWEAVNAEERKKAEEEQRKPKLLEPIGLHELRHTFASLMIAAGVPAKALSTYCGHSSITITLDLYGHLMPGEEAESARLLGEYLTRGDTAGRLAQLEAEGGGDDRAGE